MNRSERLKVIASTYSRWEREHERSVPVDPDLANNSPSQYPEGAVPVSATPDMEAEFQRKLRRAGLRK